MHAYRDQYASLFRGGRDIVLIAISTDTPEALQSWAADDEFPFLFASDPGSEVGQQYGAFREGRDGNLIDNRTLFIIDPEGRIVKRYLGLDHEPRQIAEDLEAVAIGG